MKLDDERISQALSSQFLHFAPISYISPQNRSKFDPIYQLILHVSSSKLFIACSIGTIQVSRYAFCLK